ncbi:sensor histidine kinase [Phnomibacter ginsenosidimutans]|uniref:Signal transduction histidine kinase internal region domain-containing protein n=1 Tax=Phnomibacter ginsenosidimutans TaxID=2676868 RepID=A0A6I6GMY1_9BACT|nr:histidine kinase [Phnomibacter ginsenosidimutans]QGW28292.1 hypothetical protein GLV81_09455 [Phnomibacter ginsenosidimutans]
MLMLRFICLLYLLLQLSSVPAFSSDTLLVTDRITVLLPGVVEAQVDREQRRLLLYDAPFRMLLGGAVVTARGSLLWWEAAENGYWLDAVEMSIVPVDALPQRWQTVAADDMILDTLLEEGAAFDCWFRTAGSRAGWRMLRVERQAMTPQLGGVMLKPLRDTQDLGARVYAVGHGQGSKYMWQPMTGGLPVLAPAMTAELYLLRPKGLGDSCMEYSVLNEDGVAWPQGWLRTGHLLRLPPLPAGKVHQLVIRYPFSTRSQVVQVPMGRYWYQEPVWVALLVLGLCVGAGLMLYLPHRKKMRKEATAKAVMQEQLHRLQLQLNPHFLYNALSSIAGLVGAQQYREANIYLAQFGELLRQTIEHSKGDKPFTLSQELCMLDRYCQLEQLRFGFMYTIEKDEGLDAEVVQLPAMLVQPLVENAIRHGLSGMREKGWVKIAYLREGGGPGD